MDINFCGESLWNSDTLYLIFTDCFNQTLLVYVPCAFLIFSLIYEYFNVKYNSDLKIQWNFLNVGKLILCLILFVSNVADLSLSLYDAFNYGNVYPVQYTTPLIKSFTYCVAFILLIIHRKNGIHTSGSLFIFWTFMTIYAALNYRPIFVNYYGKSRNNEYLEPNDIETERSFIFKTIEFPIILSQFFLGFFADLRSKFLPDQDDGNANPKEFASFPNQMLFEWVSKIIRLGYKRPLKLADMWNLNFYYKIEYVIEEFNRRWNKKKFDSKLNIEVRKSIALIIFTTFWPLFAYVFVLKLVQTILMFFSPIILDYLITFMSSDDPNWLGYVYSFGLFGVSFLESIFVNQYEFYLGVLIMKIKTSLMSTVYSKALVLSSVGRKQFSTGEIVNIMAVDIAMIANYINMVNILWSAPIQLIVCFYLLWQQLGISTLAGVATLIALIPVNAFYTTKIKKVQIKLLRQKDKRSKLIDEVLNGIKIIKLYGWEKSFKDKIQSIRNEEVQYLTSNAYYSMGIIFAFSCSTFVVSLISFTVYVLINPSNALTPNKVFVSLALLNQLRLPFNFLPIAIMFGTIAAVSVKRVTKYLNSDELSSKKDDDENESYNSEEFKEDSKYAIQIKDGEFSWEKGQEPFLKDINLKIEKNSLVAIVGPVGCGKTTLVNAIINELYKKSGTLKVNGRISYVSQVPWILNNTFKENILFMNPFNQELYDQVIKICALKDDLKVLAGGDSIEIGEKGINLSGGQKQRVSLARACYNNSDIYILDDVLSAVDAHVGGHLFEKVIGKNGFLKNKTRVLVTHKVTLLKDVDRIIVIKDGRISEQGSYDELIEAKGDFSEILNQYISEEKEDESIEKSVKKEMKLDDKSVNAQARKKSIKGDSKLIGEEKQEIGSVKWKVYKRFLGSMPIWFAIFTLVGFAASSGFNIGSNLWLTSWSEDSLNPKLANDTRMRNKRIGVYAAFGIADAIANLMGALLLNIGLIQASKHLHIRMIGSMLRAPQSFFDSTPIGRVLNRFTQDMSTVDGTLISNFRFLLLQLFRAIVSIIIFCIETPIFLAVAAPLAFFYVWIQKVYIAASRQLKRLQSITVSPIYSHFSETVQGASSIRAYGLSEKFIKECHRRIDKNSQCYYVSIAVVRWLTIRLGFLGFIVVLFSGVFAVLYRDTLSPSLAGLAISFSLNFTVLLGSLIKSYSDVETDIVAVERCFEYTNLESEAPTKTDLQPDRNWPNNGVIKFQNYSTTYRADLPPVIKNLTLEINKGEKIGIVGRTGAGKSTLTLAIFRILEPSTGTIEIDNINIKDLGLDDLRSSITIIPQDPWAFADSLRMNLDPFSKYTDDEIWKCLELANLRDFVKEQPEGLNKKLDEGGSNLSVGQRQLLCLARALLRKTKILILDEATASVDFNTDELIQKAIRKVFSKNTILTIAHRLNTIIDYDRVIVLENGELKEFDSPKALLENKNSIFYSMAKESNLV